MTGVIRGYNPYKSISGVITLLGCPAGSGCKWILSPAVLISSLLHLEWNRLLPKFNCIFRDPQEWDPFMVSFPYYSHIFRDSDGSGMGIVWETYHKGVRLLRVPENATDKLVMRIPATKLMNVVKKSIHGASGYIVL